eukprot:7188857-Pyramimonas_sp.AAC.1
MQLVKIWILMSSHAPATLRSRLGADAFLRLKSSDHAARKNAFRMLSPDLSGLLLSNHPHCSR